MIIEIDLKKTRRKRTSHLLDFVRFDGVTPLFLLAPLLLPLLLMESVSLTCEEFFELLEGLLRFNCLPPALPTLPVVYLVFGVDTDAFLAFLADCLAPYCLALITFLMSFSVDSLGLRFAAMIVTKPDLFALLFCLLFASKFAKSSSIWSSPSSLSSSSISFLTPDPTLTLIPGLGRFLDWEVVFPADGAPFDFFYYSSLCCSSMLSRVRLRVSGGGINCWSLSKIHFFS